MSVRDGAGHECEQNSREDIQTATFLSSFCFTLTPFQSYKQLSNQLIGQISNNYSAQGTLVFVVVKAVHKTSELSAFVVLLRRQVLKEH